MNAFIKYALAGVSIVVLSGAAEAKLQDCSKKTKEQIKAIEYLASVDKAFPGCNLNQLKISKVPKAKVVDDEVKTPLPIAATKWQALAQPMELNPFQFSIGATASAVTPSLWKVKTSSGMALMGGGEARLQYNLNPTFYTFASPGVETTLNDGISTPGGGYMGVNVAIPQVRIPAESARVPLIGKTLSFNGKTLGGGSEKVGATYSYTAKSTFTTATAKLGLGSNLGYGFYAEGYGEFQQLWMDTTANVAAKPVLPAGTPAVLTKIVNSLPAYTFQQKFKDHSLRYGGGANLGWRKQLSADWHVDVAVGLDASKALTKTGYVPNLLAAEHVMGKIAYDF